ncbi:type II toxin-antitoxin system RelE/ParE family toxin [Thermosulfurimonas sp. F29]|uniref:type II toxin-antitoxin system RelE family toxin n=1 Tax=Thermosulfurimonas sp. F29 TaxID=2867247 RepID=UPI001C83A87E|nr:type II toxin-antitoxin system RelE/ParE family toxin [Thermosulfurimonas sp. F29]MBX6423911.1 type II toxin-antitoxin system RelE/ParE family toxin [Thermosulfurimonas sp. F29]
MFKVVVHKRAASYLKRLPKDQKERLKKALQDLGHNPFQSGVKAMVGEWRGYYRLRIGSFRVIFWLDRKARTIYVDYIGPRGDIYKRG